jgi:transposase
VQVLDEPGKKAESLSYMWVQARAGPRPIVLFTYDPTRKKEVPKKLLEGFQGYLQVDGYGGYDEFCQTSGVIRLGCWAHARRKFFDATKVKARPGLSNKGLKFIQRLYQVEDEAKDLGFDERKCLRLEKSKVILDEFRLWLDEVLPQVPPTTALGKALGYADREWPHLIRYLENGGLKIDNNFIENKIRSFAVGRKKWLFSQSVEGAEASAGLFSLVETTKANGLDPYKYIRHLCEKIPHAKTLEDFEALLPWHVKPI